MNKGTNNTTGSFCLIMILFYISLSMFAFFLNYIALTIIGADFKWVELLSTGYIIGFVILWIFVKAVETK